MEWTYGRCLETGCVLEWAMNVIVDECGVSRADEMEVEEV